MNELLKRKYSPEQMKAVDCKTDDLDNDDKSYEIESIVSHRLNDEGVWVYTVKWKGYDESHNQEIPYESFDSKASVIKYYRKKNMKNPHNNVPSKQAKQIPVKQIPDKQVPAKQNNNNINNNDNNPNKRKLRAQPNRNNNKRKKH
ncbi:hypothetical protein BGZ76_007801, partial [Entomortierella beljakovae]